MVNPLQYEHLICYTECFTPFVGWALLVGGLFDWIGVDAIQFAKSRRSNRYAIVFMEGKACSSCLLSPHKLS